MEDRPSSQHEYEGNAAIRYEAQRNKEDKWSAEQRAFRELLDAASRTPLSILDVPIGTGRFLDLYDERGDRVVGVDVSSAMLDQARLHAAQRNLKPTLQLGSIKSLPFADGAFDLAVCVRFLNLVGPKGVKTSVRELVRVAPNRVIIGLRTYGWPIAPYHLARRTRNRVLRRYEKVIPQPQHLLNQLLDECNLTIARSIEIQRGRRYSSHYRLYLLERSPIAPAAPWHS